MIEYHVFQESLYRDSYCIDIYRGMDKDDAVKYTKLSISDLENSILGHRWRTRVRYREISDWQDLDINDLKV